MEVNELLDRFEKVRIVPALFADKERGTPTCYKKKSSPFLNEAGNLYTVILLLRERRKKGSENKEIFCHIRFLMYIA